MANRPRTLLLAATLAFALSAFASPETATQVRKRSWTPDNRNGTFTNPSCIGGIADFHGFQVTIPSQRAGDRKRVGR